MKNKKKFYGIRNQIIVFTVLSAILPLGMMGILLAYSINGKVTELNVEKYLYNNSKMLGNYQIMEQSFEELTRSYITNAYIQKSLAQRILLPQDQMYVNRSLWYINNPYSEYGIFIDNKGNEYASARVTPSVDVKDVLSEELYDALQNSYASLKIMYSTIVTRGKEDSGIFLVRNIRHLEKNVDPGILIIKLNRDFYKNIFMDVDKHEAAIYLMGTIDGAVCGEMKGTEWEGEIDGEIMKTAAQKLESTEETTIYFDAGKCICFASIDDIQGFLFVSIVPKIVIEEPIRNFMKMLMVIMFVSAALCIMMATSVSRPIQKAILKISCVMSHFDEKSLNQEIQILTNTELDQTAASYNKMLKHIEGLIQEVKKEQEELRINEYNSLAYQINPHFLYNTLDNIYMLARMDGNETMMQMIQSLSSMLRISISKGENEVSVKEELEHIKSYMNIEQIRNGNLFSWKIEAQEDILSVKIPKLMLQPVIENCIKYGFDTIEEGGKIDVCAKKEENNLVITISNNGSTVETETLMKLNQMQFQKIEEIKQIFPQKKGGYGVANVVSRLWLKYRDQFQFNYRCLEDGGTECRIVLPIEND